MRSLKARYATAFLFLAATFAAASGEARVFDMNEAGAAAYLRGTGGPSSIDEKAINKTSGFDTRYYDEVEYNLSGEIGFAYQFTESTVIRAGIEGLKSKEIVVDGKEIGTGTKFMEVTSNVTAFHPNLVFEMNFSKDPTSRTFMFVGAGYATVKVSNEYEVTAAGQSRYGTTGLTYEDNWETTAVSYQVGTGFEFFILDNVTMALDLGWRFLPTKGYKYGADAEIIRGGTVTTVSEGDTVTNDYGKKPELDLGGGFVAVTFKFYLPSL